MMVLALQGTPAAAAGWRDAYADMLQRHTRAVPQTVGTVVDYAALRSDPRWRALVAELSAADAQATRTRAEKLAFWINAYNILAIDLVVEKRPRKSIKDLGNFLFPVWGREAGEIGGRSVSLGEIEHEILRPMQEPRIHAAIVCASVSCPSLRREPYLAERIDEQLDEAMRIFLADTRKGARVDPAGNRLLLSSIFDWFAEDFGPVGGVRVFLSSYLPEAAAAWLKGRTDDVVVAYLDYDWSLNRPAAGR